MTAHAECFVCAWGYTAPDSRAEQAGDDHEDETGHRVKIHYIGDRR